MSTIPNLPEELLLLIFKQMWPSPVTQSQYVCKSWYRAAHKWVLKHIQIPFIKIPKFIASIDHNPDPAYLSAVQVICIQDYNNDTQKCHLLDEEMIEKMLCRFPNLRAVWLNDTSIVYDEFNDQVCEIVLKRCLKLGSFVINTQLPPNATREEQDEYLETHRKLRFLLTSMNLNNVDFRLQRESSIDFMSQFPRLQTISDVPDLNNFQKLLPIFEHLTNLKEIELEDVKWDHEGFAETYLATRTKDEQSHITKALSAVKTLKLCSEGVFGVNSVKFIAKYFTGLHTISMASFDNQNLTRRRSQLLDTIMDVVCTAIDKGTAYFFNVRKDDLRTYLPSIISKLYQKTSLKKEFRIEMKEEYGDEDEDEPPDELVDLTIEINKSTRTSKIILATKLDLRSIPTILPIKSDADSFIIDIDRSCGKYAQEITSSVYDHILATTPSLQEVTDEPFTIWQVLL